MILSYFFILEQFSTQNFQSNDVFKIIVTYDKQPNMTKKYSFVILISLAQNHEKFIKRGGPKSRKKSPTVDLW